MYGTYRNSGIRSMRDYKEALRWYEATTPIRGNGVNAGLRPLGHRGKMQFQIRKTDEGDIVCQCWKTDVVTFHPDGVVSIKTDGWDSQTTANFIKDVLGVGAMVSDRDVQLRIGNGYYRIKKGIKLKRHDTLLGTGSSYEVIDCQPHVTHSIDRKAMNQLRKKVQGFRTYLAGVIKLRGGEVFERDELNAALEAVGQTVRGNWDISIQQWRQDVEDVSVRQHAALADMMAEDKDGSWYRCALMLIFNGNGWAGRIRASGQDVVKHLDDLLIATHPQVLQPIQVEAGVLRRDRYKKFLPYKELANA
jgi:hypothetical protein